MRNQRIFRRITTFAIAVTIMVTMFLPASAFASDDKNLLSAESKDKITQEEYDKLGTTLLVNTPEEDEALKQKGIPANLSDITNNKSITINEVTSSAFVSSYGTSRKYYTTDFWQIQYNNNCTPTLAANILSYFQSPRGVSLNAGNITQSLYNQICIDVGYTTSSGSNLNGVANGLKTWANRYGKTAVVDKYWLNNWSDVTRDINANKPVMLGYEKHAYLIFGYKVENNVQYLFVFTGWNDVPYQWLKFEGGLGGKMEMQSVNIY
ncbi:MAG: C39 family peptidase [Clostridia bacterium]|nr:C39 family peptidase [Clostridia bacterium]